MKITPTIALLAGLSLSAPSLAIPGLKPEEIPKLEERVAKVQVSFPGGTVTGRSLLGSESFAAIPFADPPIGDLRLRPPKKFVRKLDKFDGTGIAPACPQQFVATEAIDFISKVGSFALKLPLFDRLTGQEDCLTVTVQRPAGTTADAKLPVLFWIFGGGFTLGSTNTYDATSFLATAVAQRQPFVFVAVNYRLNGFGFLAGKEILKDDSSNLGLLDQRMGLEWVADNIAAFGGDPSKVTIWGESAGAISVFDQMLLYGGNATYKGSSLFRAAIMDSGALIPADPVDSPQAQAIYDQVVVKAGCSAASDTLNCLRLAPYDTFYDAVTSVTAFIGLNDIKLSYIPRPDGKVLMDSGEILVKKGLLHTVPIISGNQEDEGTLFGSLNPNLTTTDKVVNFLSTRLTPNLPRDKIEELVYMYPTSITAGSPFRTGIFNELYPGYKRFSAILGDVILALSRRVLLRMLKQAKPDMPTWSYLASYFHGTPVLGTFHASDILQIFYGIIPNYATASIRTYYLNFVHNLDPNIGVRGFANWPQWSEGNKLMWFQSQLQNGVLDDDFRDESAKFLEKNVELLRM